jgi:4-amino-4-deoxy-L-arabinose transferase-like glycosyltransferase
MVLNLFQRCIILLLLLGVVVFMTLHPIRYSVFGPTSDEGYYYKYASLVVRKGQGAFSTLISWYASSDEARKHPAPIRAGYILLSAFLFEIFGNPNYRILAFISSVSFFYFLCICFYYIRKYFDLDTALLSVLLLASSPLMLGLSRRALIESPLNMLWGLTVWLFLDVLLKPDRYSYIFFLGALIVSIMFKETSLILIPFFVAAGILGRRQGAVIRVSQIWGTVICPLVCVFLFYAWLYGGWGVLKTAFMAIAKTHLSSDNTSAYAINYCSGPWFKYLVDFLLVTPVETVLFIGYVGCLCIDREILDLKKVYFLSYFVYVYGVLNMLSHTKVVRYVVNLEMVMAVFAILMLAEIFKRMGGKKGRHFLFIACLGIFLYNLFSFYDVFYKSSLLDPISHHLLVNRHFIPG